MSIAATIERMHLAVPRPSNQTAAALLWTYGTLPAFSGSTNLEPWRRVGGTIERLIWQAAGYEREGDRFHAASDRKWWERPFAAPSDLWGALARMAAAYDIEHPNATEPPWRADIATGAPAALKAYLVLAWETLQGARAKKPPKRDPRIPERPTKPIPVPSPPLPLPRRGGGGFLLLLLLGAAVAWKTRKR